MYDTSAPMLVLICWLKQQVPGQAQAMDETNHNDTQFRSGLKTFIWNVNKINSLLETQDTDLNYMLKI